VATDPRIYLRDGEAEALTLSTLGLRDGRQRVVPLAFGPGAVWLDPQSVDEQGNYPRWIVARLGILRGLDITSMELTEDERVELEAFAAEHGRELIG
jgi:hypothetical protein